MPWRDALPSAAQLRCEGFGQPNLAHSFTQEACAETCLFHVLASGFLDDDDRSALFRGTNTLGEHLDSMRRALADYGFSWLQAIGPNYASQQKISDKKSLAMMACLFHYDMDVSLVVRYLGKYVD